jgi:hypothetical protein
VPKILVDLDMYCRNKYDKEGLKPVVVVHTCRLNTQEAEAGASQLQGQPSLDSEIQCQNKGSIG